MSNYRDDREALRQKADELTAETSRLRQESEAAQEAREASEQRAKALEAEVAELRQRHATIDEEAPAKKKGSSPGVFIIAGLVVSLGAAGAVVALFTVRTSVSAPVVEPTIPTSELVWKIDPPKVAVRPVSPTSAAKRVTITNSKTPGKLHDVLLKSEPSGAEVRSLGSEIVLGHTPIIVSLDGPKTLRVKLVATTANEGAPEKTVKLDTQTAKLVVYFDQ